MAFAATISGAFNPAFDPKDGRKGRRQPPFGASFDPMGLGNDLLLWFDPTTLTSGAITQWTDRKAGKTLSGAGTGSCTYDGSMVVIGAAAFLFGNATWNEPAPFEVWQVVDQTEAAGSANATSLAFGAGPESLELLYTPPIGGQSSANVAGTALFGGDNYHGIHVIRWQIGPNSQLGWLDRKPGVPASVGYTNPLAPASWFIGANVSGANLWKGRIGDTIATKPLSSAEVNAMWDFLTARAGL